MPTESTLLSNTAAIHTLTGSLHIYLPVFHILHRHVFYQPHSIDRPEKLISFSVHLAAFDTINDRLFVPPSDLFS